MTRGILVIAALALTLLTGCVTDQVAPTAFSPQPGQAGIRITRTGGLYGAAVSADVDANGERIASLASGGSYSGGVRPGPLVLTVSCWSSPGHYTIRTNVEAGKVYDFQITPRGEQFGAGMAGSVVGLAADTAINGEKSGAFVIAAAAQ